MRRLERSFAAALTILLIASAQVDAASRRPKKQLPAEAPVPSTPADKRDRTVAAPGTPFNTRAYWQAAAQCGGIYFKLNTLYSEQAVRAKVIKPDPPAYAQFTKEADAAAKTATAFFDAAERFLMTDRKITRDEAVMVYDGLSASNGDRQKTVEAAIQATKPCPELYATCRAAYPQMCANPSALTN
jgi:hypothetical protein